MTRRWSLRTRFVVAAALCLLPLVGVALFLLDQSLEHSRHQLIDTQFAISDVVAQGLTATLNENQLALQFVAENPLVRTMDATQAQEPLDQVRQARSGLNGLFLLDPEQQVVTISGGTDPAPLLPFFQDVVDRALVGGELGISDSIPLPESDVSVIALVAPVLPDPEQPGESQPVGTVGAVGAFLAVERIQDVFLNASGSASGETTIAVVSERMVIADRATDSGQGQVLTSVLLDAPVKEALAGKRNSLTYEAPGGTERLAVVAPVAFPGVQWAIVVTSPSPLTYGPNRDLLERGLIALAGAVLLTLILAVIFGELTARPIRQLTQQAGAITQGDLSHPLQPVGRGEVATLSNAVRDMADRLTTQVRDTEAAREELAHQAGRLRDLLRRTVRLQEDERRRIASEIHDAVSPLITGALYQTRAIKLTADKANGDHAGEGNGNGHANGHEEELATVGELLEKAMAELHDVIFALRPPDLDDLGVVAAIDRYVQQINRTGLPCELEVVGEPQRLSPEARLGVYRIVQEALHNALRHAHADEALVRMEWLEDQLRVTIRDNGSGFDPDQAAKPTSLGLLSMRERAAAIGAKLEIASRPGTGTAVILERALAGDLVTEPLPEAADEEPVAELDEEATLPEAEAAEPVGLREVRSA